MRDLTTHAGGIYITRNNARKQSFARTLRGKKAKMLSLFPFFGPGWDLAFPEDSLLVHFAVTWTRWNPHECYVFERLLSI